MGDKIKVIMDCDPGIDDGIALAYAAAHQDELEIDLPGFKKEDVKIQLKNGYLNIQATREEKKDEKDDKGKYVRRERYTGTCNRSFYVGSSIKHEDIHAKYENGILHVTFPKEETKKEAEEKKFVSID